MTQKRYWKGTKVGRTGQDPVVNLYEKKKSNFHIIDWIGCLCVLWNNLIIYKIFNFFKYINKSDIYKTYRTTTRKFVEWNRYRQDSWNKKKEYKKKTDPFLFAENAKHPRGNQQGISRKIPALRNIFISAQKIYIRTIYSRIEKCVYFFFWGKARWRIFICSGNFSNRPRWWMR